MLRARLHGLLVGILLLAFFLQCLLASRGKSPVWDEPLHIVSGASYIGTGVVNANLQHPPLVKELAGISLALAGIHWDGPIGDRPSWEWDAASPFLTEAGAARALFWARLPLILLAPLLPLLVYLWGRTVAGPRAGLCALLLCVADPTMVAHSYLVTTDAAVTSFGLLFLLLLYRYLRNPGTRTLLWASLALGAVLCTKFSAILLIPIAAVLLFLGAPSSNPRPERLAFAVRALANMGLVSLAMIFVLYLSWRGPYLYLLGLHRVNGDHIQGFLVYLGGHLKTRFWTYFAAAWLLKEPLATIGLALAGTVLVVRSARMDRLTKTFLMLPPAVFFAACTVGADNIGIRYLMPAMVFGFLAGGIALAALWDGELPNQLLAGALAAWLVFVAAGIYPDHLSYFNEAACLDGHAGRIGRDGGSRCGPDWLADSNVDWGQSLPQLKAWMDSHPSLPAVHVIYYGFLPPEAYGVPADANEHLKPSPGRGVYAVSAHLLAYGLADPKLGWLRQEPAAVIGHAYYIYDLPF